MITPADLDRLYLLGDAAFEQVNKIRKTLNGKEHALGDDDICMMVGYGIERQLNQERPSPTEWR